LAAALGVREVDAPAIAVIHVTHRSSNASFGHDRVSLAQKRFRDYRDLRARDGSFYGGPQTCASRADYQDIVLVLDVFGH
jgi:hypothetical protein